MATTVGPIISKLLRRVRDPQATTHTRLFVLEILGHAQQIVNSLSALVLENATLNLDKGLLLYQTASTVPNSVAIIDVVHNGYSLYRSDLVKLKAINNNWPRSRASAIEMFAPIGRDLLILYPGINRSGDSVTIYYVKDVSNLANENATISIARDYESLMESFAEILLLIKQRDINEAEHAFKRMAKRVQEVKR